MTRINLGISVKNLTDEHLLAEHREIKRLPYVYTQRINKNNNIGRIPLNFTLGKGHVIFFIDKPKITLERYKSIYEECINRGFNIEDYSDKWECYPQEMFKNVIKDETFYKKTIQNRIIEKINLSTKKNWHYYKKSITKNEAIEILIKKIK